MWKLVAGILVTFAVGLIAFVLPIAGFLFGAFTGWVVGWVFPETFSQFFIAVGLVAQTETQLSGLPVIGWTPFEPWQIGGMLGFAGGFFKSVSFTSKGD